VLVLGRVTHGSQRWIPLGLFDLQPSELAKLLIIITLAKFLSDQGEDIKRLRPVLISLVHVAVPMALIYIQPDLGTSIVLGFIWLGMTVLAGARIRQLLFLAIPALLAAPLVWLYLLKDYQRERVMVFLDPYRDPLGAGYNPIQSLVSVGSGGLFGKGLTAGTQSQLHFLRIQHTDYIFSVLGEELGFVGAVAFFVLLVVILLVLADAPPLDAGQLVAASVVIMLFAQSLRQRGITRVCRSGSASLYQFGGSSLLTLYWRRVAFRHRCHTRARSGFGVLLSGVGSAARDRCTGAVPDLPRW
jgi:rod shape determining protein RodA